MDGTTVPILLRSCWTLTSNPDSTKSHVPIDAIASKMPRDQALARRTQERHEWWTFHTGICWSSEQCFCCNPSRFRGLVFVELGLNPDVETQKCRLLD